MDITIRTPNAPGAQFNENMEGHIIGLHEYLDNKAPDFSEPYTQFQQHAGFIKEKSARVVFPFLKYAGIISDYNVVSKKIFTNLGLAYYHSIRALRCLKENDSAPAEARKLLVDLKKNIIRSAIANIIKRAKYGATFKMILEHLVRWKEINEKEFALLIYMNENNGVQKKDYEDLMSQKGVDVNFTVLKRDGTPVGLVCYSYLIGSLKAAGIVSEDGRLECASETLRRMCNA